MSKYFFHKSTHSYIRYFMKLFYKREKEWIWKSQVHHTTIWYSWQQLCVAFKWGISTFPNKKLMLGNNKEQSYNSRWNSPKFIRIFIVCTYNRFTDLKSLKVSLRMHLILLEFIRSNCKDDNPWKTWVGKLVILFMYKTLKMKFFLSINQKGLGKEFHKCEIIASKRL